ncbi:hypothetical protein [Enterobacter hormaechei]|nr:hypothetical protein [Enterobacter hormaechei]HCR1986468.1 hypothetical protein [Enterobacter hormaechei subsp. steigerwaltii]EKY1715954.1 hypothetical protein [Enterobacter hormaechei]ELV3455871.1 hypothetical protein [Enterobacter hormaechei]KJO85054.1 hypothetical protein SR97_11635 [Enterobacter hormaechei subsp. xiangfangensis]KJP28355.1 hypothetical protein SR77_09265 [Enterobacter hormaechei subsp. xiangfangensis]
MSTLTKEWLLKTIAELEEERDAMPGAVNEDAAMSLAAMKRALASLMADPVAWTDEQELRDVEKYGCGYLFTANPITPNADPHRVIKLYTASPAPMLPEEMPKGLAGQIVSLLAHNIGDKLLAQKIWNACRAAMLQGAEPVSNRDELPDGWVMLPAEPTQAMMNAWLSEVANWRGHAAGYRAMIAAAPQQEVK